MPALLCAYAHFFDIYAAAAMPLSARCHASWLSTPDYAIYSAAFRLRRCAYTAPMRRGAAAITSADYGERGYAAFALAGLRRRAQSAEWLAAGCRRHFRRMQRRLSFTSASACMPLMPAL